MNHRLTMMAALLALLSGCALGPDYVRPEVDLPAQFRGASASADGQAALAEKSWQAVFPDPVLQKLIDEALLAGPDALLAAARLREAEALAGVARAPLLPQASLSLNSSPIARLPGEHLSSSYLAGLGVSWEIDLWGRYRRADEAARAQMLASEASGHGVQAALVGAVANYYYQLVALRETLLVTTRAIENQQSVLTLVRRLSASGIASAAEERQQESALAATAARLPVLRRQISEAENALSLLLGRHPGAIRFETPAALELPGFVPPGLPASLLERRPDIRQAEANLIAANARVGEAKAMLFPNVSLTAIFGGVSTSLGDVLHGRGSTVASVGPGLLQPLFAGGRLQFNRKAAEARLEQSLIAYRKTVLGALGEVADALAAYESSAEVLELQGQRVTAAREAMRLADLRFRAGTTSFLEVLDAQRQLLAAETEQAQSLLERRTAWVRIYLALGGGWAERP